MNSFTSGPRFFSVGAVPAFLLVIAFLTAGCAQSLRRDIYHVDEYVHIPEKLPTLKVHMKDGNGYVFDEWSLTDDSRALRGEGLYLNSNRYPIDTGSFLVQLDSVALFEADRLVQSPAIVPMLLVSAISAGITVYCINNPKACFGSCPTFFVEGQESQRPVAEGFSSSVAPGLEATDIDVLYSARPANREFNLIMTNEALETHVVRHVNLLAARREPGERILPDIKGQFYTVSHFRAPLRQSGALPSFLAEIAAFDGTEFKSPADSFDLSTKQTIELEFQTEPGESPALVIGARQTLLTTYLFYQLLAYMGTEAPRFLARLQPGDKVAVGLAGNIGEVLGGIEVLMRDSLGDLQLAGVARETGPLASDIRFIPLPVARSGKFSVVLRMTRGHYRLDYIALARMGKRVDPIQLEPVAAVRAGQPESTDLDGLLDPERSITTLPGDSVTITYLLPDEYSQYDYFLQSRGYYLEWMRDEWLEESNPALAFRMLTDPAWALRDLAPKFKAMEDEIEETFWQSRYGR